ncbi:MAG TPA: hypothetical protein VF735_07580 [Pyrinomonadaceae bacterium]|jgi:hypothetical protein
MRPAITFMLRAGAAFALATTFAPLVSGQRSGSAAEARTRVMREARERELRDNEMRERAFDLRMVEEEARRHPAVPRREPRLDIAQIREDFVRLQVVNYDLSDAVSRSSRSSGALDLKLIAKSVADIKKRARRLRDNMMLPETENVFERPQMEVGPDVRQLKSSLSVLKKLIIGFVNNPIFREANVVDLQLSAKAKHDLEDIIELSEQIKKCSEKLNKLTAQK